MWLVVPGGVEGQLAQQFAVIGEDADVQVAYEDEHAGSGGTGTGPMWCRRLLWRRVITPELSMRS